MTAGLLTPPEKTPQYDPEKSWRAWQSLYGALTGQADWAASIHLLANLQVDGTTTLASLSTTGNVTIGGTLGVTGATTLSSTLHVVGAATLDSTLSAGATTVTTLHATGLVTLDDAISMTAAQSRLIGGATSFRIRNHADNLDNLLITDVGNTTVRGTLNVNSNTSLGGTLGVTGATTLSSTLSAGATTVTTLHATGAATLDSTLSAGATTVTTLHATGAATLDSTLSAGATTVTTLHATGAATLDSTLSAGATTVTTLHGTSNADIDGTFNADGAATLGSTLNVTGTTTLAGATATTFTATTYVASGSTTATSGAFRSPNNDGLYGRNAANNENITLARIDSSNNVAVGEASGSMNNLFLISPNTAYLYGGGSIRVQVDATGVAFFASTPVAVQTIGGAATDLATVITLANNIRSALRNFGLCN